MISFPYSEVKKKVVVKVVIYGLMGAIDGILFQDLNHSPRTLSAKQLRKLTHESSSCIGYSFYNRDIKKQLNCALEFLLQTLSVKFGGSYNSRTKMVKGLGAGWISRYRKLDIEERVKMFIPPSFFEDESSKGDQENNNLAI